MMRLHMIAAYLMLAGVAHAQDDRVAFEVASVKVNNSGTTIANGGGVTGDRFTAINATAIQLLRAAYGVQEFQIADQPGWTGVERFDITAKVPAGAQPDQWPIMLQNLLAERFRLKLRREQRERNAYALVVGSRGLRVKPVDSSKCAPPNRCGFNATPTSIVGTGQSMEQLATRLSRSMGETVVDRTGVSGIFDFTVEWTQDDQFRAPGASASPAIFTALTEQLGLRLQAARVPVEMLVIVNVGRPTPD
jgi:uncharacterized protein (TIGR03435 family)